ncbi:MAG TPA: transcription-repair coupling factor [Steroidobacteraceae bacterium]|nr:transcription-repair coupling factor [Steroidobacteraceae bacterium]HRX89099.1 transcription-repair coupling factor [Steroidobacteraceae bacterium]
MSQPIPSLLQPHQARGGQLVRWSQLYGSSARLALAEALAADSRLWLIVADDARELDPLKAELEFFLDGRAAVHAFPDWEVLPYDSFSPHADIISERLATLAELPRLVHGAVLVAADTLVQRLPPRGYVDGRSFVLTVGERLPVEPLRQRLTEAGYAAVGQVASPGEFAVRGALVDVFPMGADVPLRLDLFDEEIETIRTFDPETQRSLDTLPHVRMLPGRELPLDPEAIKNFRRRYRSRFDGDPNKSQIYRGVSDGIAPPGIEFYLPLFFETTASLFDYLPAATVVAADSDLALSLERAWRSIEERYEDRRHDLERPLLAPQEVFIEPAKLLAWTERVARIEWQHFKIEQPDAGPSSRQTKVDDPEAAVQNFATGAPRDLQLDTRAERPLAPLESFLQSFDGRVLIVAESAGRREVLQQMLRAGRHAAVAVSGWAEFLLSSARLAIAIAADIGGLVLPAAGIALLSESQLFGSRARQERRRRKTAADPQAILRDLMTLSPGAPVVHEEYGVGRYVGLEAMEVAGQPGEFLVIEYRDGDRIYAPVQSLHLVSRYAGAAPDGAPLHKLGTEQWARARKRAAEQIRDVAAELLDLYSQRQARTGTKLTVGELEYQSFANAFPFEETADQAEAIEHVLQDIASGKPMDRIVCGDVGFGKTEVAMRAAFVAAQAGKQVAVLVPTTLLAEQHLVNFRDRFADWPVHIEALSRFRSGKQANAVLEGVEDGTVDIVIATHKLLHANVRFKRLGLVIVDEEHRFGVRDKERLKALRAEVHVLTLTATPIPRTLNMALGGLRELSIISTPPAERLAIKTFVVEWNATILREACLRELRRGGQVYLVHNEVQTIEKIADDIRRIVPEADVRVGHGQMRERDLEQLMVDFYHRRFNLLVCTTIIESGIDVPTANTIIINRADKLGLAQLHQLRGRVGRSHHRAYAYLVAPPVKALSTDAVKRLEAIESLEDLGAGFVLATHDLEIRGAGELLGESQSGEMTEVGLSMYLDLLDQAVRALKEGRTPRLDQPLSATTEVELRVPALLPVDYIADVPLRLTLYKRIAAATDSATLDELTAELIDRFGELPPAAQNLLAIARLKLTARALGIRRLDLGLQGGYVLFEADAAVDPARLVKLLQSPGREYRLEGPVKLRISRQLERSSDRFEFARSLLEYLGAKAAT